MLCSFDRSYCSVTLKLISLWENAPVLDWIVAELPNIAEVAKISGIRLPNFFTSF